MVIDSKMKVERVWEISGGCYCYVTGYMDVEGVKRKCSSMSRSYDHRRSRQMTSSPGKTSRPDLRSSFAHLEQAALVTVAARPAPFLPKPHLLDST